MFENIRYAWNVVNLRKNVEIAGERAQQGRYEVAKSFYEQALRYGERAMRLSEKAKDKIEGLDKIMKHVRQIIKLVEQGILTDDMKKDPKGSMAEIFKIYQEADAKIMEAKEENARTRARILGLEKGEEITTHSLEFKLQNSPDPDRTKAVLNQIGERRYGQKEGGYVVGGHSWWDNSWYLNLCYPKECINGVIDSIHVSDDGDVEVEFTRGQREIASGTKRKVLDTKAQQIFEEIKLGLENLR